LPSRALLAGGFLAIGVLARGATAAADARHAGAIGLIGLFHGERSMSDGRSDSGSVERIDFGAGAIADLGARLGPLRLGGALGLAAVTSADGVRSRVYMPLAVSFGLSLAADPIEIELRARAGLWGGATDLGLRADLWASGGLLIGLDLGSGVRAQVGVDVWLQRAEVSSAMGNVTGLAVYYGPVLGLRWDDPAERATVDDESVRDAAVGPEADAPSVPSDRPAGGDSPAAGDVLEAGADAPSDDDGTTGAATPAGGAAVPAEGRSFR
jgi:hypothetical protein